MEKRILIQKENGDLVDITNLGPIDYENFIDAMLRLTSAYIKAVRKKNNNTESE